MRRYAMGNDQATYGLSRGPNLHPFLTLLPFLSVFINSVVNLVNVKETLQSIIGGRRRRKMGHYKEQHKEVFSSLLAPT